MGIYLHPTTKEFTDRIAKKTFVDQSELLAVVADKINDVDHKYIAVSRTRRFGKTVDANMIIAFLEKNGNQTQFNRLKIASHKEVCDAHQGKYDVVKLDMAVNILDFKDIRSFVKSIVDDVLEELDAAFPESRISLKKPLSNAFAKIHDILCQNERPTQFILVVDEWDAPLRVFQNDTEGQKYYISWLNSLFKNKDYNALSYMTGILPVKKYGDDSFMNMFDEYSMIDPGAFAPYMGFTEKDVEDLCYRHGKKTTPFKKWYDGYLLTTAADDYDEETDDLIRTYTDLHVFNPKSIARSLDEGKLGDYWDRTGLFGSLKRYIDSDLLGLRTSILEMMNGERKHVNTKVYKNNLASLTSINQVFTLLVHLGYLTYDAKSEEVYIPNRELMEEFKDATQEEAPEYRMLGMLLNDSMKLLRDTWDRKADRVARAIEKSHMYACSPKDYNNELALSIPVDQAHPAMVIELKWSKGGDGARPDPRQELHGQAQALRGKHPLRGD